MAICPQSVTFFVPPTATYIITFQGVTVQDNNSIWCYSVSVTGNPGLSHWVLGVFELCPELLEEKLISVTRNDVELEENTGYVLGTSDGVFGVKFEIGVEAEESPVLYCITLEGVYEKTAVDVAVKGGPTAAQKAEEALCGPSCELARTQEQALTDLLESIALEEAALAHLLNAEAEKVQAVVPDENENEVNFAEMLEVNESVRRIVITAIKMQILLQFKLEQVLDFKKKLEFPDSD